MGMIFWIIRLYIKIALAILPILLLIYFFVPPKTILKTIVKFTSSYENIHSINSETSKVVEFKTNTTIGEFGHVLVQNNIISQPALLNLFHRVISRLYGNKLDTALKSGHYKFEPNTHYIDILLKIYNHEIELAHIHIPSGITYSEVYTILAQHTNLCGPLTWQDFQNKVIFPDTYKVEFCTKRKDMLNILDNTQRNILQNYWNKYSKKLEDTIKTPYEALILASIIETESHNREEKKKIASVFLNRLQKNMKLQSDSTIIYAKYNGKTNRQHKVFLKDMKIESPYNTYYTKKLPPKPIATVTKETLDSLFEHKNTDYLFFVAYKDLHLYSSNYAGHLKNIKIMRESY